MDRRSACALLGTLLVVAAGCSSGRRATGPRTPPSPGERPTDADGGSLAVSDLDVEAADDGHLRVLATVRNPTDGERTGRLRIRVVIDGKRTERTREVTVPANGEREVTLEFESVAYGDFSGNGSVQSELL